MSKYWEHETPTEVITDKNTLRWYKEAGQLAISRSDDKGATRPGKTVTLNVSAIDGDEVQAVSDILRDVIVRLEAQNEQ